MSVHFEPCATEAPLPIEYRTADQLCPSPFNVRRHQGDATDTADIEATLPTKGLLLPLRVHPIADDPARDGVHAGARRHLAIRRLIERGALPADFPIPVFVSRGRTDAELLEESIVENRDRKDLRAYEIYAGVAEAHRLGDPIAKIAAGIGESADWVRQAIRLGTLAPPIFAAFAAERLAADQAKAYGATEDHALQLAVFAELDPLDDRLKTPAAIRKRLGFGKVELDRLLRFVGEKAYRDAGGRYELDLFPDDAEVRGRVADEPLLRRLAEMRLEEMRKDIRLRAGRPQLRFVQDAPLQPGFAVTDHQLRVAPQLGGDRIGLPDGDVVARIAINAAGLAEVEYWWASRSAKFGTPAKARPARPKSAAVAAAVAPPSPAATSARPAARPPTPFRHPGIAIAHTHDLGNMEPVRAQADAAIRDADGLSADSVQIFRSLRQAALRAILLDDADAGGSGIALDYLIFAQLRMLLGDDRDDQLGLRAIHRENATGVGDGLIKARPHVDASPAGVRWGRAIAEIVGRPFMTERDLVLAFRHYRVEPHRLRQRAAAIVAGHALERSLNADGYRVPLHDAIAADAVLRAHLTPTAELLDLLPTGKRLAIVEPMVEGPTFAPWARLKSADITRRVLDVLSGGAAGVRAAMRDAAKSWVHPLLRFADPAPASVPSPAAETKELAR